MIGSEIVLASVKSQDNATIGYRDTFSIPQQCHKYLRCTGVNFHPLENRPSSESTLIHTCYYTFLPCWRMSMLPWLFCRGIFTIFTAVASSCFLYCPYKRDLPCMSVFEHMCMNGFGNAFCQTWGSYFTSCFCLPRVSHCPSSWSSFRMQRTVRLWVYCRKKRPLSTFLVYSIYWWRVC